MAEPCCGVFWRFDPDFKCGQEATVFIVSACVHEHIERTWICSDCLHHFDIENMFCSPCRRAGEIECTISELSREPRETLTR